MKKILTVVLVLTISFYFSDNTYAQAGQESHGNALNIFAGFGDTSSVTGMYEFEITPDITVSPTATIWFGDYDGFGLGVRADYYFDRLLGLHQSWDIYAGVDTNMNFDGADFNIQGHVGAEYMITQKWGIIGEFGFGNISSGSIGVGIHF